MFRFMVRLRALVLICVFQVLPAAAQSDSPLMSSASASPTQGVPIDANSSKPLTFEELVDRARAGNPQWAAALTLPKAAEGDLLQAAAVPNPVLGLGTGVETPFRSTGTTLSWSQELELGGKRRARLEAAQARLEAAQQQAREVERGLLLELRSAFVELLYAQSLAALKDEALDLGEKSLQLTQGRLLAGDVAGVDVMQFEVQVARRRSEFEQAQGEVAAARILLARLLGQKPEPPLLIQGELGQTRVLPSLEELQAISSERADLLQAIAQVEAAEREIAVQETRGISNLTTTLGFGRDRTFIDGDAISPRGIITNISDNAWTASLQLSIPLPINDTNRGNIARAKAEAEGAQLNREASHQIVRGEVAQAYAQWAAAVRSLAPLRETDLDTARRAQSIAEESYKLGYGTFYEVLQSRGQYLELRQTRLDAQRSLELALARLEAAIGQPIGGDTP